MWAVQYPVSHQESQEDHDQVFAEDPEERLERCKVKRRQIG